MARPHEISEYTSALQRVLERYHSRCYPRPVLYVCLFQMRMGMRVGTMNLCCSGHEFVQPCTYLS